MYLEVYVFNSLVVTEKQVYDDATLPEFPQLDILKKQLEEQVPDIEWLDVETGQINTSDYQGQLLFDDNRKTIYFRIIGGNDPLKLVLNLCEANNWISYTPENNRFLEKNLDGIKYWQEYKAYNNVIYDVFHKGRTKK